MGSCRVIAWHMHGNHMAIAWGSIYTRPPCHPHACAMRPPCVRHACAMRSRSFALGHAHVHRCSGERPELAPLVGLALPGPRIVPRGFGAVMSYDNLARRFCSVPIEQPTTSFHPARTCGGPIGPSASGHLALWKYDCVFVSICRTRRSSVTRETPWSRMVDRMRVHVTSFA